MRRSPLVRYVLPGLCALWLAAPLAAYTIFMKDGSKLQARTKYTVEGNRAIIELFNGTKTFVPLAKVDVKKTDEFNKVNYGNAEVLPGAPQELPPSEGTGGPKEKTLTEMMARGEAGVRALPENRRPAAPMTGSKAKLPGGAYDLVSWARKPFADVAVATELKRLLSQQGLEEVEIYEGTKAERPFVEVTTNSEGSVFRALAGTVATLPLLRQTYSKVGVLEVLMLTTERERAGQFTITPEMANDIATKKVDLISFYLKNVQF
jgi:hypothetical protein